MSIDLVKIGKTISYALRHHPEKFNLTLDEEGWCDVSDLLKAIHRHTGIELRMEHLQQLMENSDKKRYELNGHRIRACYGHSIPKTISYQKQEPPTLLYHGTARRFIASIRQQGLCPQNRQYVHLSSDEATAYRVGKRHDDQPIILVIQAKKAYEDGINFYHANDTTWLCEHIDTAYILFQN